MLSPAYRAALAAIGVFLACSGDAKADDVYREGFEDKASSWRREETDASITVQAHERSTKAAHEGRTSERFAFTAGPGSVLYYSLECPRKIPITADLRVSLYARSSRPGVQVFGRIVLPGDIDPETGRASFVLVQGETIEDVDKWIKLDLGDLKENLAREARVLRIGSKRKVSLEGAYLERLVVNLYGGAGETEVFLDDLTIRPLSPEGPKEPLADVDDPPPPLPAENGEAERPAKDSGARVQLRGSQIYRDGKDFVPMIVDAPGADPQILAQHGVDAICLDADAPKRIAEAAIKARLLLVPRFKITSDSTPEAVLAEIERYPYSRDVAFWNLGENLGSARRLMDRKDELDKVRAVISGVQDFPDAKPRLTIGTVEDFLPEYALAGRELDLIGIEPHGWGTVREPKDSYRFLQQRRELTATKNPRLLYLAWIDASAPPDATRNVWGDADPPEWGRPQVQPEQIRMQAYAALSAGYRALGFKAGPEITGTAGRSRLIEMAFLNFETDLMQSHIARGTDPIVFHNCFPKDFEIPILYSTTGSTLGMNQQKYDPFAKLRKETPPHESIKAASIPTLDGRGRLLLVCDYAMNAQYQPPQAGLNDLKLLIPAPVNAQAFEISPGGVTVLTKERTTGGTRFTIPVFSESAMILVTTDLSMKARVEAEVARIAPMATQMAIAQARAELAETVEIHARLVRYGHDARDAADLLAQAAETIKAAEEAREHEDFALAWSEARRAGRAVRVLKKSHFNKAWIGLTQMTNKLAKDEDPKFPYPLTSVVASPPLTSWQTLPQHWLWMDMIRERARFFGENLVPTGTFEVKDIPELAVAGLVDVSHQTDGVDVRYEISPDGGYGKGSSALRLLVKPKDLDVKTIEKIRPFLDHPAVAIKSPPVEVYKNCLVRVRVLVRLTRALPPGTGGLIVEDSIGGEPYEFRMQSGVLQWTEVTLYRKAPKDGTMTVTLGLAGYGEAFFDRLRIDTLTTPGEDDENAPTRDDAPPPIARRLAPPRVNPTAGDETRPRR